MRGVHHTYFRDLCEQINGLDLACEVHALGFPPSLKRNVTEFFSSGDGHRKKINTKETTWVIIYLIIY